MTVDQLHALGELPSEVHSLDLLVSAVDGPPNLLNSIKIKYKTLQDKPLRSMHNIVLLEFLIWKLQSDNEEILYLFKQNAALRHRSFHSIMKMFQLLVEDIGFSIEKIKCNSFLLCLQALKVSEMLKEFPYVLDVKITDLIKVHPRILSTRIDHLKRIEQLLKKHNINKQQIRLNGNVLSLHPDTVSERLNILENTEEIRDMKTNSEYLKLVASFKRALKRLEYLKANKLPFTIVILYASEGYFQNHFSSPDDRLLRKKIIDYLVYYLKVDRSVVRNKLRNHYIKAEVNSVDNVMKILKLLTNNNFSTEDILNNISLILVKYETVKEELKSVKNNNLEKTVNLISSSLPEVPLPSTHSLLPIKRGKKKYGRYRVQDQLTIDKLTFSERKMKFFAAFEVILIIFTSHYSIYI